MWLFAFLLTADLGLHVPLTFDHVIGGEKQQSESSGSLR